MNVTTLNAIFARVRSLLNPQTRTWALYWSDLPGMGYPHDYNALKVTEPPVLLPYHILLEPKVFDHFLKRMEKEFIGNRDALEKNDDIRFAVAVSLAILSVIKISSSARQMISPRDDPYGLLALQLTAPQAVGLVNEITAVIVDSRLEKPVVQAADVTVSYVIGWRPVDSPTRDSRGHSGILQSKQAILLYAEELIARTLHGLTERVLGFEARLGSHPSLGVQPEKYFSKRFIELFISRMRYCDCGLSVSRGHKSYSRRRPTQDERETIALFAIDDEKSWDMLRSGLANDLKKFVACLTQHDLMLFHPTSVGQSGAFQFQVFGQLKYFIERAINGNCGKTRPIGHYGRPAIRDQWASFQQGMLYRLLLRERQFSDLKLVKVLQRMCDNKDCVRIDKPTASIVCPNCKADLTMQPQFPVSSYLVLTNDPSFERRRAYYCHIEKCLDGSRKACLNHIKAKGNLYTGESCPRCGNSEKRGRPKTVYEYVSQIWSRGRPQPPPERKSKGESSSISQARLSNERETWMSVALTIVCKDKLSWTELPQHLWNQAKLDELYQKIYRLSQHVPARQEFAGRLWELLQQR